MITSHQLKRLSHFRRIRCSAAEMGRAFNVAVVVTIGLAFLLAPGMAPAATFNIANGDVAGLIAAIQTANANCAAATTINLAPGGTYTLTAVGENPREYNGPGSVGLPVIRVSVTINGKAQPFNVAQPPARRILCLSRYRAEQSPGPLLATLTPS
jgi:hypothetical protein